MFTEQQKEEFMLTVVQTKAEELFEFAEGEYRHLGRGIVLLRFGPAPDWAPKIEGAVTGMISRGYATIADVEAEGDPDDADVLELLQKYDPSSQVCYAIDWPDGSCSIGRFGRNALTDPTPGMKPLKRPTAHDAIFGKPQNARDN